MTDHSASSSGAQGQEGYVLPAENAAEMARLMMQDHLLTQAMGGPLPEQSDLSGVQRVLDIGCGPGGWLFDVVAQYPEIQGVGIDISQLMTEYAASIALTERLPQLQFRIMDATKPLDFPDNSFDLVNGRILTGFLSRHHWSALLAECFRITRPGGILRLTEAEWRFTNSAGLDKLSEFSARGLYLAGHSFSPHGRTMGTSPMLRFLVRRAGFVGIQHQASAVDYSYGSELHESNTQNHLVVAKLLQPFLAKIGAATQEDLDKYHAQAEQEVQNADFCAVDYFLTVWGHKPM